MQSASGNSCSVEGLIHSEDAIPMLGKLTDNTQDEAFFYELGLVDKQLSTEDNDSIKLWSEEAEVEHTTIVHSYSDTIMKCLKMFANILHKGHTDKATLVISFVSTVADIYISYKALASERQSFITDIFNRTRLLATWLCIFIQNQ